LAAAERDLVERRGPRQQEDKLDVRNDDKLPRNWKKRLKDEHNVQHSQISTDNETEAQVAEEIEDWRKTGDGEEWNKRIKELDSGEIEGLGRRAPAEIGWRAELERMAYNNTDTTPVEEKGPQQEDWMWMNELHTRHLLPRKHDYRETMTASSWHFSGREHHRATEASSIKAEFLQKHPEAPTRKRRGHFTKAIGRRPV
jgi:hypothetical protein